MNTVCDDTSSDGRDPRTFWWLMAVTNMLSAALVLYSCTYLLMSLVLEALRRMLVLSCLYTTSRFLIASASTTTASFATCTCQGEAQTP